MKKNILSVLIILIFFGCSKNNNLSTGPTKSNGLMPLSVGNFWQYTTVNYDTNSVPIDTSSDKISITAQFGINDTTYFQMQWQDFPNNTGALLVNVDSNTLDKVDTSSQYVFFKRSQSDSTLVDSWADTVSTRCKGHNDLFAFTDVTDINGYACLRNVVYVSDCTGTKFEKWVYYLKPGFGFVRILHYVLNSGGTFYIQFSEDVTTSHII
jgi:hypothetical protein